MIRPLQEKTDVDAICRDGSLVDDAVERAAREARLKHKQLGVPLVVWRDGQIVHIPPEEIVVDPLDASDSKPEVEHDH